MLPIFALAATGAFVACAGADAAQPDNHAQADFERAAAVMVPLGTATPDGQRDVIDPPSSIDPGMALDPPQTGAKMPIIHPPGVTLNGKLILPR